MYSENLMNLTTTQSQTWESLPESVDSSQLHWFFFRFEDRVSLYEWQEWCMQRRSWPLIAVPVYLTAMVWGQALMRQRKPFDAKGLLLAWNSGLALFSILGVVRVAPPLVHQLRSRGFEDSICVNRPDHVVSLWIFLFTMSKFVELGDTAFLVLRKRRVLFLHWFHHVTVLLYTWFAFTHNAPTGKYFILVNFFVHSLMYAYFACQTLGIKAPTLVSISITSLQILQMVIGIVLLICSVRQYIRDSGCATHPNILLSGILMYGSYFCLFVQFFVNSYLTGKKKPILDQNSNHVKSQ